MSLDFNVASWLAAEAMTREVVAALDARGVRSLLLKGATIGGWIYDAGEPRGYGDVDLLVAPDELADVERALKELGFVNRYDGVSPGWAQEHADAWIAEGRLATIDLHRRLWGVSADPADAWRVLWDGRERVEVGGYAAQALGEDARTLALALHAAHHGTLSPKAEEDLRRGIARLDEATWRAAADVARRVDAEPGLSGGLALLPEGVVLRDRLGLEPADREAVVVEPWSWSLPASADGLMRLRAAEGVRAKADMLRREIVPSRQFMRTRSREMMLARRGSLGLVAAYGSRWIRLLRSLPAGAAAARRARAESLR